MMTTRNVYPPFMRNNIRLKSGKTWKRFERFRSGSESGRSRNQARVGTLKACDLFTLRAPNRGAFHALDGWDRARTGGAQVLPFESSFLGQQL